MHELHILALEHTNGGHETARRSSIMAAVGVMMMLGTHNRPVMVHGSKPVADASQRRPDSILGASEVDKCRAGGPANCMCGQRRDREERQRRVVLASNDFVRLQDSIYTNRTLHIAQCQPLGRPAGNQPDRKPCLLSGSGCAAQCGGGCIASSELCVLQQGGRLWLVCAAHSQVWISIFASSIIWPSPQRWC